MLKILLLPLSIPIIGFAKFFVWIERNIFSSHVRRGKKVNKYKGMVRHLQDQAIDEARKYRELQESHRQEMDELDRKHEQALVEQRRKLDSNRL